MTLLDDRLQRAADADAVAAHFHEMRLLLVVGVNGVVLLGILGPELEDVADLDAAAHLQRLARQRAGFARAHAAEIAELRHGEVARDIDVPQVEAVLVRTGRAVADEADRLVGEDASQRAGILNRTLDRAEAAGLGAHDRLDFLRRRRTREAEAQRTQLRLLEFVAAAQDDEERLAVADVDEGLELLVRRHRVRRGFQCGDRHDARRSKLFQRPHRHGVGEVLRHEGAGGFLAVGRVAALVVVDHVVVADLGRHHELVGKAAAHHAGISLDGDGVSADAAEERLVGGLHRMVALAGALVVRVERVGVHHHEFTRAHQAEARPDLVAEFRGDLEKVLRQVAVAGDLGLHERRDDLLMGRPEHVLRLACGALAVARAVGAEHDLARHRPAGAVAPGVSRMHVGHPELDRARTLHLLAADLRELLHYAQAHRHVGIEAAAQFAHQTGAHEQLVRGDFGVRGAFFQRGDKILRPEFHEVRQRNTPGAPEQFYLRPGPPPAMNTLPCPPPAA